MKADLERKVHELLDAGRDPADDPDIRSAMADDEDMRAEVAGLSKLEGWLRDWEVNVPNEDFEPIAQRIEQRLDEPLGSFDATAPPVFDDPDAKVSSLGGERGAVRSGEYSLDALAGAVDAPPSVAMTGPSPAVALSAPPRPEPKRKAPIAPWLAAAAVVALGVTVSVATLNQADEPAAVGMAAPQAEQAPGMFPAAPAEEATSEAPPEEPLAMAEAEEAEPIEEEAEATEALDDYERAPRGTATESAAVGGSSPRSRTSRGSAMASAMTTATTRTGSPFDTASGGGSPPMAQGAALEGAGESERRAAVERSKPAVRACLGAAADSAVVMVRFRDGAVRDARVVRPSGNDATNECVASALRRARIRPEGQQERRTLYYRWGTPSDAYHQ